MPDLTRHAQGLYASESIIDVLGYMSEEDPGSQCSLSCFCGGGFFCLECVFIVRSMRDFRSDVNNPSHYRSERL